MWNNFDTSKRHLWDNFETSLSYKTTFRQVWKNIEQLWHNFDTTLANLETTLVTSAVKRTLVLSCWEVCIFQIYFNSLLGKEQIGSGSAVDLFCVSECHPVPWRRPWPVCATSSAAPPRGFVTTPTRPLATPVTMPRKQIDVLYTSNTSISLDNTLYNTDTNNDISNTHLLAMIVD